MQPDPGTARQTIRRALSAVRQHFGMEVAFVSRFADGRAYFRDVEAPATEAVVCPGASVDLDQVYCRHVFEGRLPGVIPDTSAEPLAAALPITAAGPIGAYMSVPIWLPDGSHYGMFCCFRADPDPSLNDRDLRMMKVFAEIAGFEISRDLEAEREATAKRERIGRLIAEGRLSVVYQPIWDVRELVPVGMECLTRFSALPARSPDEWFAEAAETELGSVLEIAALRNAFAGWGALPEHVYLAVNASPKTVLGDAFREALDSVPVERLVLEITEHAPVEDYNLFLSAIQPLRRAGLRLAVDDAGAGYSTLQHILNLSPDFIKLDMALTRNIDRDPVRRALASALVAFARDTGSTVVAEGVETESELAALKTLGIDRAQGFFLARPMPLENAIGLFGAGRASASA
ncbi:EAL domain-containing protein [Rhizobiales bacterium L72]|uniref:EAL domain-containing protein n=2 Tax=Propylenella binzhouense TaxID=2555902 RepID=A0A964T3Y0_9HYPH|nr:EAL domain-containing protein [Propylenella binzhouense]